MKKENIKLESDRISKKIKENLDLILSAGGVLLGIFIIYMFHIRGIQQQQDIAVIIFIASAAYLLLRNRLLKTSNKLDLKAGMRLILLNNIVFFIALGLSVWLLWSNLYMRPLSYFILVSIASASIALEILYANKKKWIGVILFKILLIGITLGGGIYFIYDGIQGMDVFVHNSQIEIYIENGHIVKDPNPYRIYNTYYSFPIHYVLSAFTSILTSLNVYSSIFVSTAFMEVFIIVFIFFMGQRIVNTKTGLFAALIFGISDMHIRWASNPVPMVLGLVFCTEILYLLIAKTSNTVQNRILIIFLSIIVILTHTVAAFVLLVIFSMLFIGKEINKYMQNVNVKVPIYVMSSTVAVFCIMLFAYWMYAFRCPECTSFFGRSVHALYSGLTQFAEFGTKAIIARSYETINYFEIVLNDLGYLLVLFFGIIGTYIWVKIRDDSSKLPLAVLMIVLFACSYGFYFFGMRMILPSRWFIFIYLILMIISAYGIFKLISLTNKKITKVITVVALVAVISFFMIHSTVSNNTPIFFEESAGRVGYKTTELVGRETINSIFSGQINATSPWYLAFEYNSYAHLNNKTIWSLPDPEFLFSEYTIRYLFSWSDVLGNDSGELIKFLKNDLKLKWVENAEINKSDDGKTINVTDGNNSFIFKLDEQEKKVNLEISSVKIYEYLLKDENGKLNIYNMSKEIGNLYVINRDAFNYPGVFKKIGEHSRVPIILNNTAENKLNLNGNKIYDNGEVRGYLIKE